MNFRTTAVFAGILLAAAAAGAAPLPQSQPVNPPAAGQTREGLSMKSALLGRDVNFAVYLPPDYAASARRYPVVYLLHGYTDNESAWIQWGEIALSADRAIADRTIPPMIIVMPDAGVTWYVNDAAGRVPYEDMFFKEFIPTIDAAYRTRPDRGNRGVAGLSMGGWGSLTYIMRHPDVFESCAAFSAAMWTEADMAATPADRYDKMFAPLFGPRSAAGAVPLEIFRKLNPLNLAASLPEETLKTIRIYLDCGDDDFLIEADMAFHAALLKRKIPHEFRVRDGEHTWSYWRTGIIDGLAFIGESFRR